MTALTPILDIVYQTATDPVLPTTATQDLAESVEAAILPTLQSTDIITGLTAWTINYERQWVHRSGWVWNEVSLIRTTANLAAGARNYALGSWGATARKPPAVFLSTTARTTAGHAVVNISNSSWEIDDMGDGIAINESIAILFGFQVDPATL